MNVRLRGHHLLCMLGYRGMGYSTEYVANMTRIYETLRLEPATAVQIVAGPDDLCAAFPCQLAYHCEDAHVGERDAAILSRLQLHVGDERPWADVLRRIRADVVPDDIPVWCATCPWQPYGLCAQGVDIVRAGVSLPSVSGLRQDAPEIAHIQRPVRQDDPGTERAGNTTTWSLGEIEVG